MGIPPAKPARATAGFPEHTPGLQPGHRRRARLGDRSARSTWPTATRPSPTSGVAAEPYIDREGHRPAAARCSTTTRCRPTGRSAPTSPPTSPTPSSRTSSPAPAPPPSALERPAAGKTGTATNGNDEVSSAWFAGYTPQLSTAVMYVRGKGNEQLEGWLPVVLRRQLPGPDLDRGHEPRHGGPRGRGLPGARSTSTARRPPTATRRTRRRRAPPQPDAEADQEAEQPGSEPGADHRAPGDPAADVDAAHHAAADPAAHAGAHRSPARLWADDRPADAAPPSSPPAPQHRRAGQPTAAGRRPRRRLVGGLVGGAGRPRGDRPAPLDAALDLVRRRATSTRPGRRGRRCP